jgi:DNA-binding NarL/FixJ family response regulator
VGGYYHSPASNKEIADRLNLAEGTVKNHVTNILTKLDVRDRNRMAINDDIHRILAGQRLSAHAPRGAPILANVMASR